MPSAEFVAPTGAEPRRLRWAAHDVRDLRIPGRPAQPRILVATALTVPVLVLVAAPGLQFLHWQWLGLCLTAPVVIWGAAPFHRTGWAGLRQGRITTAALVSLATLAGLAWSALALFVGGAGAPGLRQPLVPDPLGDPGGGGQLYLGVAAVVTVCALVGRSLDWQAMRRTELATSVTLPAAADGREPTPRAGAAPRLVGLHGTLILVLAAGALGFWLAASGIVPLALQAATGVLIAACPGGLALSSSLVWGLARSRLQEMGVQIHQPEALAVARRVDTMVVALGPREHLRPDAAGAIDQLNRLGVQPVVLSDQEDRASTAVQRLHSQGRFVARLGDGPGDLLIVANHPTGDPWAHPDLWTGLDALRFCRRAHQIVRLNVVLAVLCAMAMLPVAATGRLNPTVAAAATVVSVALVVANSVRIRRVRASRPPAHRSRGRTTA